VGIAMFDNFMSKIPNIKREWQNRQLMDLNDDDYNLDYMGEIHLTVGEMRAIVQTLIDADSKLSLIAHRGMLSDKMAEKDREEMEREMINISGRLRAMYESR
jgi:hypothetical protein